MAQMCPAKSTIVPFKKQMYGSGSIILSYKDDKCICVSIHAPTRGATLPKQLLIACQISFNPRTHEGCDCWCYCYCSFCSCFNPRTHEGCDCWCYCYCSFCSCFNPRTHEGCDVIHFACGGSRPCFNPRTHEGCDLMIM